MTTQQHIKGIDVYSVFLAMQMHCNPSKKYDYFKYGPMVVTEKTFSINKLRWKFESLAQQIQSVEQAAQVYIANFLCGDFKYGLCKYHRTTNVMQVWSKWNDRIRSIKDIFQMDIRFLYEKEIVLYDVDSLCRLVSNGNDLSIETWTILVKMHGFSNTESRQYDVLLDSYLNIAEAYSGFLKLSDPAIMNEYRSILNESYGLSL